MMPRKARCLLSGRSGMYEPISRQQHCDHPFQEFRPSFLATDVAVKVAPVPASNIGLAF